MMPATLEISTDEFKDSPMGSFNHGYLQIRLGKMLDNDQYTVCAELSLDLSGIDLSHLNIKIKDEIKPDLCLYPKRKLSRPRDILRMKDMPLLIVEILSPKQGSDDILEKFQVYFALGIKSCWLVDPAIATIAIYSSMSDRVVFSNNEAIDHSLNIHLTEIFE